MLEFISNHWTEILSVIGAAAWLPIIINPIINHFCKIQATVLDFKILTDGKSSCTLAQGEKKGTILLLVLNLFTEKMTIFARNISVKVKLNSGAILNTELLDYSAITSNNDNGTESMFIVPAEQEFNVSRTIHKGIDNIKYISMLVENASFSSAKEIDEIEINLYYSKKKKKIFSKKIVLSISDFPTYNTSHLIRKVEHIK